MSKYKSIEKNKNSNLIIFNEDADDSYTHSSFCQCALPVRRLSAEKDFYEISHGKSFLSIQSGYLKDIGSKKSIKQEVPSGSKARLLFLYINTQAISTGSPEIDMGTSLRDFMKRNNIPIGGSNGKEIERQVHNIAAANIQIGTWNDELIHQENIRVAQKMAFWLEKDPNQQTLWQPTMTISDEYMSALEKHRVPINFQSMAALQANPRAMDMYVWLTYRIYTIKRPVAISFESLHGVFGDGIKDIYKFRQTLKSALELAAPHVKDLELSFDRKHMILTNTSRSFIGYGDGQSREKVIEPPKEVDVPQDSPSVQTDPTQDATPSYHTLLSGFGLSGVQITDYERRYSQDQIETAISVTQNAIERKGGLANPAGYFNSAVINGWQLPKSKKQAEESSSTSGDLSVGKGSSSSDSLSPEEHIAIEGSLDARWGEILVALHTQFGEATYNSWIRKMQLDIERTTSDTLVIYTPTKFIKEWLLKHYGEALLKEATSTGASWEHIKMYVGKRKKADEKKAVKALELADA